MMLNNRTGFTLVEILIVIGVLGVLASMVIVAINPSKQLAQTRDAQRYHDINGLLNAVYQHMIDSNSNLTSSLIPTTPTDICTSDSDCTDMVDLNQLLGETYIIALPSDPSLDNSNGSIGYTISRDPVTNRIMITAPYCEIAGCKISVSR